VAAKIVILILSLAFVGSSTLVIRQQRLLAYAEMTQLLRAGRQLDRELYHERVLIADRLRPERIEQLAARLGPLKPLPRERRGPAFPEPPHADRELAMTELDGPFSPALRGALRWEDRLLGETSLWTGDELSAAGLLVVPVSAGDDAWPDSQPATWLDPLDDPRADL
jgi:hypothetical protein